MDTVTELTTRRLMADGPGVIGQVAAAVGRANAGVLALSAAASSGGRIMNIRMLVENPAAAAKALEDANINVFQNDALSVSLDNAEALTEVTERLGRAKVRIESAYFSTAGDTTTAVFSVSDIKAAQAAL